MQLDPIVIYGGTYEEQEIAIRSSLTQGFTAITVKPPNKGTKSAEYEKLIELVEYLKHDYQKHADCLDEISYNSGKNPRDIMYKSIKSELTRKDHVLEYQNDVQLGDCVTKMTSVRK